MTLPFGKLGKLAAKNDPRTLKLRAITKTALPPPPAWVDWHRGISSYGMMLNDSLGDCTCAALGHLEQIVSANTTSEITVPDSAVLSLYENACNYNPADPSTDQGGVEVDVLNYVRKNGLFGVDQVIAYADPDPGDITHVKQAIQLFPALYIGLALPLSAQNQDTWDVDNSANGQPGSWGGHAVVAVGYDQNDVVIVTWGLLKRMTWAFWQKYCDESHAILTHNGLPLFGGQVNLDAIEQMLTDVSDDPASLASSVPSAPIVAGPDEINNHRHGLDPESVVLRPLSEEAPDVNLVIETKRYADGSSATGVAPLPDLSPGEQAAKEFAGTGNLYRLTVPEGSAPIPEEATGLTGITCQPHNVDFAQCVPCAEEAHARAGVPFQPDMTGAAVTGPGDPEKRESD